MPTAHPKPYWIDDLERKQEGYHYGDPDALPVTIQHEGRSLRLLMPKAVAPTAVRVTASAGDLLFLMGERLDEDGVDGSIIEGGDGVVMIARKHPELDDTYWLLVWHELFPETLQYSGCQE